MGGYMTEYKKLDDYTLLTTAQLPTGGSLCRIFNFAAGEVTSIFSQEATMSKEKEAGSYSTPKAVSVSVSTALTSDMSTRKFSEFDSTVEIQFMHAKLAELGGNPPSLDEVLTGKIDKPRRSFS
jgi:hypothetical protein